MQLFDGHGGVSAAEFARDNLLELVVSSDNFSTRPGEALVRRPSSSVCSNQLMAGMVIVRALIALLSGAEHGFPGPGRALL